MQLIGSFLCASFVYQLYCLLQTLPLYLLYSLFMLFVLSFLLRGNLFVPIVKRVLTTTVIAIYMYVYLNEYKNKYVIVQLCIYIWAMFVEEYYINNCEAFRDT